MTDIAAFLHSEYSDLERVYLIFQIDYKEVDSWSQFIEEAEKQFFSECKFNENLFNQFSADSRHQVVSPDLRKWLRSFLIGKRNPTWDDVAEMFESNGPGNDYCDPHDSFSVSHIMSTMKSFTEPSEPSPVSQSANTVIETSPSPE